MDDCHNLSLAATSGLSPFSQILSLGFVWVFLHCSPMCGPIVSGLSLGGTRGFFLYQSGRALMYAIFGALAGSLGASFLSHPEWGWALVVVLAVLILIEGFPKVFERWWVTPKWLMRLTSRTSNLSPLKRAFFLGLLFSFLPCALTIWALTVAASTQDFLQGALVMLLLVALTTLPLMTVQWGFHKIFRGHQKKWSLALLGISFIWTTVIVLRANGLRLW